MVMSTNASWFFVALFAGGAAVWLTKSVIANAWFAAAVAAGVVFLLMGYYLLNHEGTPEEKGDNVYYLGLLFTLFSLMFTLVELFGSDTNLVHDTEKIRVLLKNFGIALTSTVAGIAGRVALQNWQPPMSERTLGITGDMLTTAPPLGIQGTPKDIEGFNRHLLGRIARDLTQGANALARFHRIVRSHASDSNELLRNHSAMLKQESSEFRDTLQSNADSFALDLKSQAESALQVLGGSLDTVAQQTEALLGHLQSSHDVYLAENRANTRKFLNEIQSTTGKNLDALRWNFEAAAKQSLSLAQNLTGAYEQIDKALGEFEGRIGRVTDANEALGDNANKAAKSASLLEMEIEKLRAALFEPAAKLTELLDTFTGSIRTAETEAQRAAEALRVLASEAETRAETLRQRQSSGFGFWNRR